MTRFAAAAVIVILLSVIGACPVLAGGMSPDASCCPHHTQGQIPCTETTARNCPYVLLEKAKAEQGLPLFTLSIVAVPVPAAFDPSVCLLSRSFQPAYEDSSDSYLLHRVLRI